MKITFNEYCNFHSAGYKVEDAAIQRSIFEIEIKEDTP